MTTINLEAKLLSVRTGLRVEACLKWMRHEKLSSIIDLMQRYPNTQHADCMTKATQEIEDFILSA